MDLLGPRNTRDHHTDKFQGKDLVIRRGQPLYLNLHLTEDFKREEHGFQIVFRTGAKPRVGDRSKVIVKLTDSVVKTEWSMTIVGTTTKILQLSVNIPADCVVGKYSIALQNQRRLVEDSSKTVFILFNPWVEGMAL